MDRVRAFEEMKVDMGVSPILPPDQSMAGLKNLFDGVANIAGVSVTNNFGISPIKHDPSVVAANAQILGDSLRETSGIHPKLPESDIGSFFGGAFKLVKETAQVLKEQQLANRPDSQELPTAAPAPSIGMPSPSGMG